MKTIIAGSREITDYKIIRRAIKKSGFKITEVVSGTARGVDTLGEEYAEKHNIPIKQFSADWDRYKNAAGHMRNVEMSQYAQALIAIWDGKSPGTKNMIINAQKRDLKVFIYLV